MDAATILVKQMQVLKKTLQIAVDLAVESVRAGTTALEPGTTAFERWNKNRGTLTVEQQPSSIGL
jgi:hypothetical protein